MSDSFQHMISTNKWLVNYQAEVGFTNLGRCTLTCWTFNVCFKLVLCVQVLINKVWFTLKLILANETGRHLISGEKGE